MKEVDEITDGDIKRVCRDTDGTPLRGRPPLGERPKKMVSIRLDQEIVEHFKAAGSGWQTRINAALAASIKAQVTKPENARVKKTKVRTVASKGLDRQMSVAQFDRLGCAERKDQAPAPALYADLATAVRPGRRCRSRHRGE